MWQKPILRLFLHLPALLLAVPGAHGLRETERLAANVSGAPLLPGTDGTLKHPASQVQVGSRHVAVHDPGPDKNPRSGGARTNPEQELLDCDSKKNLLEHLLDEEKRFETFLAALLVTTVVVTAGMCSFMLGVHVKPRRPSYWKSWTCNPFSDGFQAEVDVTEALRIPVQKLLDMTTKPECMGVGRDGNWATHKRFRVLRITRIEHGTLWSRFARVRGCVPRIDKLLKGMPDHFRKHTMHALDMIESVHEEREQDPAVRAFIQKLGLDASRNERLLFHGSPARGARNAAGEVMFPTDDCSPAYAVKHSGFDDRLGSAKGMYGAGTYFADMASKADQYAGRYNPPNSSGTLGEQATMFLSRVVLGCPYLTNQSLEQLRRPPCIEGHFDLNLHWTEEAMIGRPWPQKGLPLRICDHPRFDSVMGDFFVDGMKRLYREYVVYDLQCYPEFCVIYERVA